MIKATSMGAGAVIWLGGKEIEGVAHITDEQIGHVMAQAVASHDA